MKQEKILAIIPARGGSKRIPHKNMRLLLNRPLIYWTIDAAMNCSELGRIIVNTDSQNIATLAKELNVDVPFIRNTELATDHAKSIDVVLDTIQYFSIKDIHFEYIMLLQPTSPLRTSQHISEALYMLNEKKADAIISVTPCSVPPMWCNTIPNNLSMDGFISEEISSKRSQDFSTYYHINGAIYICKTEELIKQQTFYLKQNTYAYVMDKINSIDIDEEHDFFLAERILELKTE